MFKLPEIPVIHALRPSSAFVLALVALLFAIGGNTANAEVNPSKIEAVFGTAVEIRPPSVIVLASNAGLVTLVFDADSELRIGSNKANVDEVAEGDRVVSTATRNADDELVAIKTLVRVANLQPITKHVVGVVSSASDHKLSIQTRSGGVVDVLIPAGIDAPAIGDGITMVARLDRASGVLTAVGFELTRKTVERIQAAQDNAADQEEARRLAQLAIDARDKHLSALDDAARAIKRVIDSGRAEQSILDRAVKQFDEIKRRFKELQTIYEAAAQTRGETRPLLRISGGLVDEIGLVRFTIVPDGEQDADPYSVNFVYSPDETTVDLPRDRLSKISDDAENPQLLGDVRRLIDPGSELDVKYSIDGDVRTAVSIKVRPPRLVEELEAILELESIRAFNGVITLVEVDESLKDALGIVIAVNEKQDVRVAAKVTRETEITLDGRSSGIGALGAGQAVDIQFESSTVGSISDISRSDVPLRAIAIRARMSAPMEEDHISGIVESIDMDDSTITIRPTDGALIRLNVGDDVPVVRNGRQSTFENVKVGDLVVDATRPNSESDELTRLIVVARSNVKFSGTVTGIGREPARIQVTGDNGQSLNVLITDDTWVILDSRRVKFSAVVAGMNIVNGVYSVTGRGGAFYNVATIVSIESPKVGRASGIITRVNVIEGELTILSGKSSETKIIELKMPKMPLGDNFVKDGLPIRSLLKVERGDRVDFVFYVLKTGIIEKLSVVSDDFIQSRGTLVDISDNFRFVVIELTSGEIFDLWVGPNSIIQLNGRRIQTLKPVIELINKVNEQDETIRALVPEVLFNRDSLDSDQGIIMSINFQIKIDQKPRDVEDDLKSRVVELTVSGVIEAISGDRWVINGRVFTVNDETRFIGRKPDVGEVAVVALTSRPDGTFFAKRVSGARR